MLARPAAQRVCNPLTSMREYSTTASGFAGTALLAMPGERIQE
jgi:hypothetical protein